MILLPEPPAGLLSGAALFLDFDGTLIELAETPASILVPQGLAPLLARLHDRLEGRLAIVSGRAVDDLEAHLPATSIAFSGSHGVEMRLADGRRLPVVVPHDLVAVRAAVRAFASGQAGLLVEDKPAGIALHFRQAPEAAVAVEGFMQDMSARHDLAIQRGSMVVELRPHGADKGDAVRGFMRDPPFIGARPIFVGDDLTDEHAFAAVAELGGAGVLVGPERQTAARYCLPSVPAVTAWLEQSA
jgi:trehalose 6-phosphate phosphatase